MAQQTKAGDSISSPEFHPNEKDRAKSNTVEGFKQMVTQTLKNWFSKAQTIGIDQETTDLPQPDVDYLQQQLQLLPHHPTYLSTLKAALEESWQQWQQGTASNCYVVLSHPTEPLFQILSNMAHSNLPAPSYLLVPDQTRHLLVDQLANLNLSSSTQDTLILLPSLDAYFFRSIQGLETIEHLIEKLTSTPACYWLIGCNHWTWTYLDSVCQIGAYFDEIAPLPSLTGQQIYNWLSNLLETLTLDWGGETTTTPTDHPYFDRLANLSWGLSQVATQLWLKSLRYPKQQDEAQSLSEVTLRVKPVVLPDLPSLTTEDHFLLYTLLLHNQITSQDLALSLGESVGRVQAQVKELLQKGLLHRHQSYLEIYPSYYIQIKTVLQNNNFLVPQA